MSDLCRHGTCEDVPTIHAEIRRPGQGSGSRVLQWDGDFCGEHAVYPIVHHMQNLDRLDTLVIVKWRWKEHGGSGEPGQVERPGGVHEGEGDHA